MKIFLSSLSPSSFLLCLLLFSFILSCFGENYSHGVVCCFVCADFSIWSECKSCGSRKSLVKIAHAPVQLFPPNLSFLFSFSYSNSLSSLLQLNSFNSEVASLKSIVSVPSSFSILLHLSIITITEFASNFLIWSKLLKNA